jgi:hypothetical protein
MVKETPEGPKGNVTFFSVLSIDVTDGRYRKPVELKL